MIGAIGWVVSLIPLGLIALVVIVSYWRHGTGPYEFRRRSSITYLVILLASVVAFAGTLGFGATTFMSGSALLVLTAVVFSGLIWPRMSARLHSFLARRAGHN